MENIDTFIKDLNINLKTYEIDHAALRFKKDEDVLLLHDELQKTGVKLSEANVNGRMIYIFKLNKPLEHKNWSISCVELPHPSKNHAYKDDGWEHIEFVLPDTNPNDLETHFLDIFPNLTKDMLSKYTFHISTPKVEGEQLLNTTISLTKHIGLAIKFHCYSIEDVVCG